MNRTHTKLDHFLKNHFYDEIFEFINLSQININYAVLFDLKNTQKSSL